MAAQAFVILMDFSMLSIEYFEYHHAQMVLNIMFYSVKLKLEFFFLDLINPILENFDECDSVEYFKDDKLEIF